MAARQPRADILSGDDLARSMKNAVVEEIRILKGKWRLYNPILAIIQIRGKDMEEADPFVQMIEKAADETCVLIKYVYLSGRVIQSEVIAEIRKLNDNPEIGGIYIQKPQGNKNPIDYNLFVNTITADKDVAGCTNENLGKLMHPRMSECFVPCMPKACLELITKSGLPIEGCHAVVIINESDPFGISMAQLLIQHEATATICNLGTRNLKALVLLADIVVSNVDKPHVIKRDLIKPGAVVIDCGLNRIPDLSYSSGSCLVGNVDFEAVCEVASYITPVPGGVEPVTAMMLIKNTVDSATYYLRNIQKKKWPLEILPLLCRTPVPSDIEIAQSQTPKHIQQLAKEIGLLPHEVDCYGKSKAKISLSVLKRLENIPSGKYIVVTGVTPTPLGEGKSTTTIGLCQALGSQLDKNVFACVRQPSQGPTFGIKGGAAGGGYSQIIPMEEFNLHLTGDIHAVTAANNLLAAQIDARMFHEATQTDKALFRRLVPEKDGKRIFSKIQVERLKKLNIVETVPTNLSEDDIARFVRLNINPSTITWQRVVDTNDRFLRKITIGESPTEQNQTREARFDISVASEIMAILALTDSLQDMRERLGKIVVANDYGGNPVTADDLGVSGALAVLMKDAIRPNLMQTLEGTPAFVHAGPFANIAHGNSSIIADKIALKLVGKDGFVVTEAGFGADIGFEKFCNIKCRASGLRPNACVIVTTIRALKMHGGGPNVTAGAPLPNEYMNENIQLVQNGFPNLGKHIDNCRKFGIPIVVAINHFRSDTYRELHFVQNYCSVSGALDTIICNNFAEGGRGAAELAKAIMKATEQPSNFQFLYDLGLSAEDKIRIIAKTIYGASDIEILPDAKAKLDEFSKQGFSNLPICMAKTHLSFSHDPTKKGVPMDFVLPITDVKASVGAGFLYPLIGSMVTMPGLPTRPSFYDIDLNVDSEKIEGGGTATLLQDPVLERVKDILSFSLDGLENPYDCDAGFVLPSSHPEVVTYHDENSNADEPMLGGIEDDTQVWGKWSPQTLRRPKTACLEPLTVIQNNTNTNSNQISRVSPSTLTVTSAATTHFSSAYVSVPALISTPISASVSTSTSSAVLAPVFSVITPEPLASTTLSTSIPSTSSALHTFASPVSKTHSTWTHRKRPRSLQTPVAERLAEAKLKLTELAIEQAKEDQVMKKALFSIRVQHEETMLEMAKLELKKRRKLFENEFEENFE